MIRVASQNVSRLIVVGLFLLVSSSAVSPVIGYAAISPSTFRQDQQPAKRSSIADRRFDWPSRDQWIRVLSMRDYNTRVVLLGVAVLGGAAGMVGSFTLLRKRALLGDALAHASLPGIAAAFILATVLGGNGKSLPVLLLGATASGMIGVGLVVLLRNKTRLKEDTALGITLSVFFGIGVALLGIIQQMKSGSAAGLESFIYGKTASMTAGDARIIIVASMVSMIGCVLLFKEFKLLCFDDGYAGSRGLPVWVLDFALMSIVVLVTIVGLQAVGLVLMVALLVIPAAAARFWTDQMSSLAMIAAVLGVVGGIMGAASSALFPRLPSGAMIVLVCAALFGFSMFFGTARGVFIRLLRRSRLNDRVRMQHLLRGMYEQDEQSHSGTPMQNDSQENGQPAENNTPAKGLRTKQGVSIEKLLQIRSWSKRELQRVVARAKDQGWVRDSANGLRLTGPGQTEAARRTREHRLWEMYLITHADIAPSRVDREADDIEHVLEPELVEELEALLDQQPISIDVPASPHA